MARHPDPVRVGPDEVRFGLGCLYIHAIREMDGWDIREFQRRPVFFRGDKYFIFARTQGSKPYAVCYELRPWPADYQQESSQSIQYDEAYVAEREAEEMTERKAAKVNWVAYPWQPLLGLLWQRFKEERLTQFGLNTRGMTIASLYLIGAFLVIEAATLCWMRYGFVEVITHSHSNSIDLALVLILLPDLMVRAGRMIGDELSAPGFYEWLVTKPKY